MKIVKLKSLFREYETELVRNYQSIFNLTSFFKLLQRIIYNKSYKNVMYTINYSIFRNISQENTLFCN